MRISLISNLVVRITAESVVIDGQVVHPVSEFLINHPCSDILLFKLAYMIHRCLQLLAIETNCYPWMKFKKKDNKTMKTCNFCKKLIVDPMVSAKLQWFGH